MIIAAIFLKHRFRLYRIMNAILLISGAVLVIRPSFIFDKFEFDNVENDYITKNWNKSVVVLFDKGIYISQKKREPHPFSKRQ